MLFLLLLEALLELLDQLVEAAEALDLGLLFLGEVLLEFLAQPLLGDHRLEEVVELVEALEVGAEGAVEFVEVALVFDHHRAGEVVELVHVGEHDVVLERVDQVEQLADRDRHLGRAHFVEQVEQHGCTLKVVADVPSPSGRGLG
ncbi:hypothetical protein D9M68_785000 [compost metagenome]